MDDSDLIKQVLESPYKEILRRTQNYALYRAGFYGNRPKAWNSKEEISDDDWSGEVCIRDLRGTDRSNPNAILPRYNIPQHKLDEVVRHIVGTGIPEERMTFNQSMPDESLRIQGEVTIIGGIYNLTYTDVKKPMRQGLLERTLLAEGSRARRIISENLWPMSLNDLNFCLNYFSTNPSNHSATVEFSSYDVSVGDIPGRNTVIWEVRNY